MEALLPDLADAGGFGKPS
jgi:hypothetical protein